MKSVESNEVAIFLVTGACGSGKSFFVKMLKNKLKNMKFKIHDFDEKIKLSNLEAVEYFLSLSEKYHMEGFSTIICGGITPNDIKNSKKYHDGIQIFGCLLNVSDEVRKNRLRSRDDYFFEAINIKNLPREELLDKICLNSVMYNIEIKQAHSYIEVDNTIDNNPNTSDEVISWILTKSNNNTFSK